MDAIDKEKYDSMTDFELVDELSQHRTCRSTEGDRRDPYRKSVT